MKHYTKSTVWIPSSGGMRKLLILQPTTAKKPAEQTPAVLWIHGGGYVIGMSEMIFISRAKALVERYGAVVVTPEYRLACCDPYPAALEDCHAALLYLRDHAPELGCNPNQIMVGGESAGGGLTAALCMLCRDRGDVSIAFQMPLYPMLDDRNTDPFRVFHNLTWGSRSNQIAWNLYHKGLQEPIPPYAAPGRQSDYRNLPPAYTFVGSREAFYRETRAYIEALQAEGIPANMDVYDCGIHAADMVMPHLPHCKIAIRKFEEAFCHAAEHYFAPQKGE